MRARRQQEEPVRTLRANGQLSRERPWPADKIERWPIERLIPYAKNARTHSPTQVDQIAASIREWGWTVPVLVDDDATIIAGHGRVLAARKLRIPEVPVMVATGWSEAQKTAYRIADNKLTLNGGWDEELLGLEFGDLQLLGFDLELTGFSEAERAAFASHTEGLTDPDEALEPPAHPISKPGDLWLLGRHRLLCGDSTAAADVKRVLGSVQPHLMVTDPPYGVDYDPNWRNEASRNGSLVHTIGATAVGKVHNDARTDWSEAWALFPGEVAYVWHAGIHAHTVADSLVSAGFSIRSQIIWNKDRLIIGRGNYHWKHEPCWYAVRQKAKGHWSGDRKQSTVWDIAHRASDTGHGTQKPVACMQRPIENNSSPGQAVYEPFSGSGTTIIAAEITGRSCHAIEIDPSYVDVAVLRWQAFTGDTARLDGDGRTFAAMAAERREPPSRPAVRQRKANGKRK
jgi:DNA modification methylase